MGLRSYLWTIAMATLNEDIIPAWIHGLEEYQQIFDLTDADWQKSILDFPGSISCFNAEAHGQAPRIVSADAIYNKSPEEMQAYAEVRFQREKSRLEERGDDILQRGSEGVESVVAMWSGNKDKFLADYPNGKSENRYQHVVMPELPYERHQFDLALCSDYVFNRSAQNNCEPSDVIRELCRVAAEARIFPLFDEKGEIAASLGPVMLELQQNHYGIEIREVKFQNLKGGNAMLRVWTETCRLT